MRTRWWLIAILLLLVVPVVYSQSASETLVNNWERIPLIDYTYWCVPTSQAMVLAFYDNYVDNAGIVVGYGRLVESWSDHSQGSNAPSLIDVIIDPATQTWRTRPDGTTWPNADQWMMDNFGYDFSFPSVVCNEDNSYCWYEIKQEIDSGRPLMWSPPGHCVVAYGYGIRANGERYIVTYDAPNHNVATARVEYAYDRCEGIRKVIPGSGGEQTMDDLALFSPDGGENLVQWVPYELSWFIWGNTIRSIDIDFSADGGNTWYPVAIGIPATSGWNSRYWAPPLSTSKGRIRLRGYSMNRAKYVAGDGSQVNFAVSSATATRNWCSCGWRDIGGSMSHHDAGDWCPPGSFLTQLDLDAAGSAADSPVVGQARCCKPCGLEVSDWGSCAWHEIRYDKSHFQVGDWCPAGTFLVQLDLDQDATHGDANSPIIGRAKCCSLPGMEAAEWGASYWMDVGGLMSHNNVGDWCLPGTFLTQLDLDGVSGSAHDSPVIGRCRCSAVDASSQGFNVHLGGGTPTTPPVELSRREDFEDGVAQQWFLDGNWTIIHEAAGNQVLRGSGHYFAEYVGGEWRDFELALRYKAIRGGMHVCFRMRGCLRYFVWLRDGMVGLSKTEPCGSLEIGRASCRERV